MFFFFWDTLYIHFLINKVSDIYFGLMREESTGESCGFLPILCFCSRPCLILFPVVIGGPEIIFSKGEACDSRALKVPVACFHPLYFDQLTII